MEYGKFYHIYNKGINSQKIFLDKDDYLRFFQLMDIYILPIADIYAYALMGNHFHFVLRIKEEEEIGFLDKENANSEDLEKKWRTYFPSGTINSDRYNRKAVPVRMLQHFFISYSKYFNEKNQRSGGLFLRKFKRIEVDTELYLKRLIIYVHNNPVKHGICEHIVEYPWSSYLSYISIKRTKLSRENVFGYFDSRANFILQHEKDNDFADVNDLLLED